MATRFTRNLRDPETGNISGREVWLRVRSLLAILISVSVLGYGGYLVYGWADTQWKAMKTVDDYEGDSGIPVEVNIAGTGSEIAETLVENDVIKSKKPFVRLWEREPDANLIQAGKYNLHKQVSSEIALRMLMDKTNIVRKTFLLKEGLWLSDYVKTLAAKTDLPEKDYSTVLQDPSKLGLPSWVKLKNNKVTNVAEGFIFPDTYELPDNPDALSMLKMTTKRFNQVAKEIDLEAGAKKLKLTPYQIVIVASIIEREVNAPADRAKVARVIYNRIAKGERLGMDSTVSYAVGKTGVMGLTDKDLNSNSPYNTRKFKGLPPGPISNPGKAALEAALHPEKGSWLYFCVVDPKTGKTEFSSNDADFQKSKRKYIKWCNDSDENYKLCYGRDR